MYCTHTRRDALRRQWENFRAARAAEEGGSRHVEYHGDYLFQVGL